jgi:hypothetical protein
MWSSGVLRPNATARELLELCFLDVGFVRAFHERCGHLGIEADLPRRLPDPSEGTELWERETRYGVSMIDANSSALMRSLCGSLATRLVETHRMELREGRLLVVCDSVVLNGPGSRLKSTSRWEADGREMTITCEVKYHAQGYTDRLIGSTVESMSIRRGGESLEQWWAQAQETLALRALMSPVSGSQNQVQRTLAFDDSGFESDESGWSDDETSVFEDAASHLASPSLRGSQGMLGLLEHEAKLLSLEQEALARRRQTLELQAMETRPHNPMARLVRWANGGRGPRGGNSTNLGAPEKSWRLALATANKKQSTWPIGRLAGLWLAVATVWLWYRQTRRV